MLLSLSNYVVAEEIENQESKKATEKSGQYFSFGPTFSHFSKTMPVDGFSNNIPGINFEFGKDLNVPCAPRARQCTLYSYTYIENGKRKSLSFSVVRIGFGSKIALADGYQIRLFFGIGRTNLSIGKNRYVGGGMFLGLRFGYNFNESHSLSMKISGVDDYFTYGTMPSIDGSNFNGGVVYSYHMDAK